MVINMLASFITHSHTGERWERGRGGGPRKNYYSNLPKILKS
jgi:hypothetical protein